MKKVVRVELTKRQQERIREETGEEASVLQVTIGRYEPSLEDFETREDFEEFREYLLGWLPGMIEHLLQFSPNKAKLADRVGVSRVTMTHWLQGERKPTLENLTKLIGAITDQVDLMATNLTTARDHLDMLRAVQEKLESGDFPKKKKKQAPKRRKGK